MNTALLTIDDFSAKIVPAMVDYFKEKGINVLFFAEGQKVERFYEEAKYALKNGMLVGNHSYSHPAFSEISLEEGIAEIEKCEAILNKLYADCGVERKYRPFRFPFGNKGGDNKEGLQKYLKENGFHKVVDTHLDYPWWKQNGLATDIDTFWTYDFEEYRIHQDPTFDKEYVWKKMQEKNPQYGAALFAENNRHIILMHAHDETEAIVPEYYKQFVERCLENGLVFDKPKFFE